MRTIHSKKGSPAEGRRAKAGMTLIEVVASLGIIGVGIVGILALFPVAIDATARTTDRTAAMLLGQYVIDQVRLHHDDIEAGFTTDKALKALDWGVYKDRAGNNYTFDATVVPSKGDGYGSGEQIVKQLEHPENDPDAHPPGLNEQHTYSRFEVALDFGKVLTQNGGAISGFPGLMQVTVTIRWPRAYSDEGRRRQNTITFVTYIRPQM